MITREDIRELAQLQVSAAEDSALSFYFEPHTPQDKSHREDAILAKDLVREALRGAEKNGKNGSVRADLQRILELAGNLHGNQSRAKAVFACGSRRFWREFDLPAQPSATQLFVNQRFHLKPLAALLGAQPRLWIALVDRHRARFFDLRLQQLTEHKSLFHTLPRYGKSDGYSGYDAGHIARRVKDEALHHFKQVSAHLLGALEKGIYDKLLIACPESNWHEFDSHLHPDVKKRLIGKFSADPGLVSEEQIRQQGARLLREWQDERGHNLVREVIGLAKANSRGVTGLRRVLRSLERGEVQSLLLGENYCARATECTSCGHLDSHLVTACPTCGQATREIDDVCDAIIPSAILRDIELFFVKGDSQLDSAGNIAALLRFRADQNKNRPLAEAS